MIKLCERYAVAAFDIKIDTENDPETSSGRLKAQKKWGQSQFFDSDRIKLTLTLFLLFMLKGYFFNL